MNTFCLAAGESKRLRRRALAWRVRRIGLVAVLAVASASAAGLAQAATYTWNRGTTSASWVSPTNWTPPRNSPSSTDVLQFNSGGTNNPTNMTSETVSQLLVTSNTTVNLLGATGHNTLTLVASASAPLSVAAGSALNLEPAVGSATLTILVIGVPLPADIRGSMSTTRSATIEGSSLSSVVFGTGAVFTSNGDLPAFGTTGTTNAIVFSSGATFVQGSASTPFGLSQPASKVVFQPGSLYRELNNAAPDFSGRTYANFEFAAGAIVSVSGSAPLTMDTLAVTQGTLNMRMTGGVSLRGNVRVSPGQTLNINPASPAVVTLNGSGVQVLGVSGALQMSSTATIALDNPAGLSLATNVTVPAGTLQFLAGNVSTNTNTLTLAAPASLLGGGPATGWVVGKLKRTVPVSGLQSYPVGSSVAYSPVVLQYTGLSASFDLTAGTTTGDHPSLAASGLNPSRSVNRYWTLTPAGALPGFSGLTLTLTFAASDVDAGANTANFQGARFAGTWTALAAGTRTATSTQITGTSASVGDIAIGEPLRTITSTAGAGGAITPSGAVSVADGANQSFAITPNSCFAIQGVTVDGVSQGAIGTYTFTNVVASHTINASFVAAPTYTISASAGANGTISPSGNVSVACGANQTFTIAPASCYHVQDVLVDGVSQGAITSYTFGSVLAGHTIAATFAANGSSTITASAGPNGSISPGGATVLACGANQPYAITPSACYHVASVVVDGVSQGAVTSYAFTNVQANHTISATFVLNSYSITASAGANGSISPNGVTTLSCLASQVYTITPASCAHVTDVLVDGVSVGPVVSYTFTGVVANHSIAASFAVNTFAITASAGPNGTVTPSGVTQVTCGAAQSYAIVPAFGYQIGGVLVDGISVGSPASYTFPAVFAPHSISASFLAFTCPDSVGIASIQNPADFCHHAVGDTVRGVAGIITGFDPLAAEFDAYVQNSPGGPFSGIDFYTHGMNTRAAPWNFAIGDSVVIELAAVDEALGHTELRAANNSFGSPDFVVRKASSGHALPPFFVGTTAQLAESPTNTFAEQYEGCLVRLNGPLTVVRTSLTGGLDQNNGFLAVSALAPFDSVFVDGNKLTAIAPPAVGTQILSVQGIMNQTTRGYRILLRDGDDLAVNTPPAVTDAYPLTDNTIKIVFDRAITAASGTSLANYSLASFGSVGAARMLSPNAVELTISNGLSHGDLETVTVNGVTGLAAGLTMSSPQSRTFVNGVLTAEEVQRANPDSLVSSVPPCTDRSRFAGAGGQVSAGASGPRVTMVGTTGAIYGAVYYLMDPLNPLRGGVAASAPPVILAVGHTWRLVGQVDEFFGETELANVVEVTDLGAGTVPTPKSIAVLSAAGDTCDYRNEFDDGEDYEGRLVTLQLVRVVQRFPTPPTDGFHVADLAFPDTIFVENFKSVLSPLVSPPIGSLASITGVIRYANGSFRICPRNYGDVVQFGNSFPITASSGPNGGISPAGVVTVAAGSSSLLTITPSANYHVADVVVDGVSVGAVSSYVFTNVLAPHTINASFAADTFALAVTTSGPGTATWSPNQPSYARGSAVQLTAMPSSGYVFNGWGGDASGTSAVLTLTMNANLSVIARFGPVAGTPADTMYIGLTPGKFNALNDYWSIYSGRGAGYHHPPAEGGMWGWEVPVHGDTLQGWWPIREAYFTSLSPTLGDTRRPWWAIDAGNSANYQINGASVHRRTFGVLGVWHVDAGAMAALPQGVSWAPISGNASAWMGLRRHGDTQYVDPITGNPFNADALQYSGSGPAGGGSDNGFPGYGSQMDQMLYRDIAVNADGQPLTISFRYRMNMSTGVNLSNATRTGWFHGDPLSTDPGHFISSTLAGATAPRDSFMVYVGAAVDDAACTYSDGVTRPVFDRQRRWLSEVIRLYGGGANAIELFTQSGSVPSPPSAQAPTVSVTLTPAQLSSIVPGGEGFVRVVFRVKTNRGFDDQSTGYSSGGSGAVQVDDVRIQHGGGLPSQIGTFESPSDIDNSLSVDAVTKWKSTGKPPSIYHHYSPLVDLAWNDPSGPPGNPSQQCDMSGGVVSAGNFDDGEAAGDSRFDSDHEQMDGIVSPTIQLCGPYDQPGGRNAIGLTADDAVATKDYYVMTDIYDGIGAVPDMAGAYRIGFQSYPERDRNGRPTWGPIRYTSLAFHAPQECFRLRVPIRANGLLHTSNTTGVPDSVRYVLGGMQVCAHYGSACNPTDGLYFDNTSLAIVDSAFTASPDTTLFADACVPDVWIKSPVTGPPARDQTAMASVTGRATVVMFGGRGVGGELSDTWEWAASDWYARPGAQHPSARSLHAMTYDRRRNRTVLFGGLLSGVPLGDTWEWNGDDWSLVATSGPSPRSRHGLTYDNRTHRVLLFGGFDGTYKNDLWTWDGVSWSQIPTTGGPSPRAGAAVAFDELRGGLIVFGGEDASGTFGDTWIWNGKHWHQSIFAGPSPRSGATLSFIANAGSLMLVGGSGPALVDNSFLWNGRRWLTYPAVAPNLSSEAMAWDEGASKLRLFGGHGTTSIQNADTWSWCCLCDEEELEVDSLGVAVDPPNLVPNSPIDEFEVTEPLGSPSVAYPGADTRTGLWMESLPCANAVGGEVDPEDTSSVDIDLINAGITGISRKAILDSLASVGRKLAVLLHDAAPFAGVHAVSPNYVQPTPHLPKAGRCYVLGGRDLIFVHGFRSGPLKAKVLRTDNRALIEWHPPTRFPARDQNPAFYTLNGTMGYWKQGADDYWQHHIERYFRDNHIMNRYITVAWPSTQRMALGVNATLAQIADAMTQGIGVVDPSGDNDTTAFGASDFVVISHSTGGPVIDAALAAANTIPALNAKYIADHCKAHIALAGAFGGTNIATAAMKASGALGVWDEFNFQWVEKVASDLLPNFTPSTWKSTQSQSIQSSVLADLVPDVMKDTWGPFLAAAPERTITCVYGHPSSSGPAKHRVLEGLDDGTLCNTSESAVTNDPSQWPSGYLLDSDWGRRFVKDVGIPRERRRGYYKDQVRDVTASEDDAGGILIASAGTKYRSPTGMRQPVGSTDPNPGYDAQARYANHFTFIQAASSHLDETPSVEDKFNDTHYEDTDADDDKTYMPNREESWAVTDTAIYDNYSPPANLSDSEPLVRVDRRPAEVSFMKSRVRSHRISIAGIKQRLLKRHKWRRFYDLLEGWEDLRLCDYVYKYVLSDGNQSSDCPDSAGFNLKVPSAQWFHDTFPFNETAGLSGTAAFDTTTALVKTGFNTAQLTGNAQRLDIPGDSLVACDCRAGRRVDLVFRILPGPGNYGPLPGRSWAPGGVPAGLLLATPTNPSVFAASGDGSFWGQYLMDPGPFASPGGHPGGVWNPNVWNSARMDTAETNLFPVSGAGAGVACPGWMSCYHEEDPRLVTLGINKFRCFVKDTSAAAGSSAVLDNVDCSGQAPAWLLGVPRSRTGWNGSVLTNEYTKIIPDGLLTPGSHVQYFIRSSSGASVEFAPDTTRVLPQPGESQASCGALGESNSGSYDGHRWQSFSVLPDRWKDPSFGGSGMACMLVVDLGDGHGDEAAWVSVAEQIGATLPAKYGAHNGWHVFNSAARLDDPANRVARNGGQAGSTWDLFNVHGVDDPLNGHAGALGSRLSNRLGGGFASGKWSRIGPTPEMLKTYYKLVYVLGGGVSGSLLGPRTDRSQDDRGLLSGFLSSGTAGGPKGLFLQGDNLITSESDVHASFFSDFMGVSLQNSSYQKASSNLDECPSLAPSSVLEPALGSTFALGQMSTSQPDVLLRVPAITEAVVADTYENFGSNGPYVAGIAKPSTVARPWVTLAQGWRLPVAFNAECRDPAGRAQLTYEALSKVFGIACATSGAPLDVDLESTRAPLTDFVELLGNPVRTGSASLRLGVPTRQVVEVEVFDLLGRRVRTLSSKSLAPGQYTLKWDRQSNNGKASAAGMYFLRVRFRSSGHEYSRKLLML